MILVTGNGFLGRSIAKELGDNAVILSRSGSDSSIKFDLTAVDKIQDQIKLLQDKDITHIIHTAATTPWGKTVDYSQDELMAKTVAILARDLGVKAVIHLSGWNVYDMSANPPYDESTPISPIDPYGASKAKIESLLAKLLPSTNLLNVRLASIYGPGQLTPGLIPNLVAKALTGMPLDISSPEVRRDYLYIDNVVRAIVDITLDSSVSDKSEAINLGSGQSYSVHEVARNIQEICRSMQIAVGEINVVQNASKGAISDNCLSIAKATSSGYLQSLTSLREGLQRYIKWRVDEHIL